MSNSYVVQEKPGTAYPFVLAQDLGNDFQGGHWFKTLAHFTHKDSAEEAARQMNLYGELYLPGKVLPVSDAVKEARRATEPR